MKLQSYKRLNIGDFSEDERALVEKLAVSLNVGIDDLYLALNKRLTFSDNFSSTQKAFEVKVNASGVPVSPVSFKLDTSQNVIPRAFGTLVVSAKNLTNTTTYPTSAPFLSFSQNQDVITINHITGLPVNNTFEITVIVLH